jgi:hypothetical protein
LGGFASVQEERESSLREASVLRDATDVDIDDVDDAAVASKDGTAVASHGEKGAGPGTKKKSKKGLHVSWSSVETSHESVNGPGEGGSDDGEDGERDDDDDENGPDYDALGSDPAPKPLPLATPQQPAPQQQPPPPQPAAAIAPLLSPPSVGLPEKINSPADFWQRYGAVARWIASDDDFLQKARVRWIFEENALEGSDAQLFEIPEEVLIQEGILTEADMAAQRQNAAEAGDEGIARGGIARGTSSGDDGSINMDSSGAPSPGSDDPLLESGLSGAGGGLHALLMARRRGSRVSPSRSSSAFPGTANEGTSPADRANRWMAKRKMRIWMHRNKYYALCILAVAGVFCIKFTMKESDAWYAYGALLIVFVACVVGFCAVDKKDRARKRALALPAGEEEMEDSVAMEAGVAMPIASTRTPVIVLGGESGGVSGGSWSSLEHSHQEQHPLGVRGAPAA